MALPTITQPEFEITLPVIGKKVKFRPFLVKEEKVLLVGKEGSANDQMNAMMQTLKNVVISPANFDPEDLTTVDVEYLFMHLRGKSINNIVELKYKDKEDDQIYDFQIDINDIEPVVTKDRNFEVALADGLIMKLKDPTMKAVKACGMDLEDVSEGAELSGSKSESVFKLVAYCIDSVYDSKNVYDDFTIDEAVEFISNIDVKSFEAIQEFFESAPKLTHTLDYKNSLGNDRQIVLSGVADFF